MKAAVTISQQAVVTLLHSLGVYTAHTWDLRRLEAALNDKFHEYLEGVRLPTEGEAAAALQLVRGAIALQSVILIDPSEIIYPERKAACAVGWRQTASRPDRTTAYSARQASWSNSPVRRNTARRGVMNVVIRELENATEQTPLTKEYLLKLLVAEFPERDVDGMTTNLNNLIPTRLKEHYGITVSRKKVGTKKFGYWIDRTERSPADIPEAAGVTAATEG